MDNMHACMWILFYAYIRSKLLVCIHSTPTSRVVDLLLQSMRSLISTTTVVVFTERVRMYDSILHVRLDDDSFSSYYTCVYVCTLVHACIVMHKMVNIILATRS